jgi:hypothetical protein
LVYILRICIQYTLLKDQVVRAKVICDVTPEIISPCIISPYISSQYHTTPYVITRLFPVLICFIPYRAVVFKIHVPWLLRPCTFGPQRKRVYFQTFVPWFFFLKKSSETLSNTQRLVGLIGHLALPNLVWDMTISHLRVDRGSMHVVQHHVTYSPKRNTLQFTKIYT